MKPKCETRQTSRKPRFQLTIIFYSQESSKFHHFLIFQVKDREMPHMKTVLKNLVECMSVECCSTGRYAWIFSRFILSFFSWCFQCLNLTIFFTIIAGNGRKGRLPFVKELWLDMKKVLIPLHGLNKYILDPIIPRKF